MDPVVLELLRRDAQIEVRGKSVLTLREAAEDLERSVPWLKQRIKRGSIATLRRGKENLVPRGEVLRIKTEGID
jgi:hypothetical protein